MKNEIPNSEKLGSKLLTESKVGEKNQKTKFIECFSGHTFDLSDLKAISPVLHRTEYHHAQLSRLMYLEYHLKDNVTLRHNHFYQDIVYTLTDKERETWKDELEVLEKHRAELVEIWVDFKLKADA